METDTLQATVNRVVEKFTAFGDTTSVKLNRDPIFGIRTRVIERESKDKHRSDDGAIVTEMVAFEVLIPVNRPDSSPVVAERAIIGNRINEVVDEGTFGELVKGVADGLRADNTTKVGITLAETCRCVDIERVDGTLARVYQFRLGEVRTETTVKLPEVDSGRLNPMKMDRDRECRS